MADRNPLLCNALRRTERFSAVAGGLVRRVCTTPHSSADRIAGEIAEAPPIVLLGGDR